MNHHVWTDAPAALAYRRALPPGELFAFPITALDRTGIPTWKTVFFDAAGTVHQGHSYGPTDAAALTGAMGELAESIFAHARIPELAREHGSYDELRARHGDDGIVHPWRLGLPAGSPVDAHTPLDWVRAQRFIDGAPVFVPLDVVMVASADAPSYVPFATPITNGLGAGPSLSFALAHGVSELLQRDGNGVVFRALDAGIELDCSAIDDPVIRELFARFAAAGIEPLVKFASDEFGIANVYVVGAERDGLTAPLPIMVTAAGEAASLSRTAALRKALLEFGAARPRKAFAHGPLAVATATAPPEYRRLIEQRVRVTQAEPRALEAMLHWLALPQRDLRALIDDPVLRIRQTRDARALPHWEAPDGTGAPGAAIAAMLAERLAAAGLDILYVDCTTPRAASAGVHVVKAIVPGLEVETMSYHRIGERNAHRLLASGSPLVTRTADGGAQPIRLLEDALERLGGPLWLDVAAVDATVGALYPLYREPDVHVAPLAREALVG